MTSLRTKRANQPTPQRPQPGQNNSRIHALIALFCTAMIAGCAHAPVTPGKQGDDGAEVKTVRGRAWIVARTPESKTSFPAAVVIDRTNIAEASLRIEALDPLGAAHTLIVLHGGKELFWVDYDGRRIYSARGSWHGIPLARLPAILLGIGEKEMVRAMDSRGVGYTVEYSQPAGASDFKLPQKVKLSSHSSSGNLDMELSWRERYWNGKVDTSLFALPKKGIEGFEREYNER